MRMGKKRCFYCGQEWDERTRPPVCKDQDNDKYKFVKVTCSEKEWIEKVCIICGMRVYIEHFDKHIDSHREK